MRVVSRREEWVRTGREGAGIGRGALRKLRKIQETQEGANRHC